MPLPSGQASAGELLGRRNDVRGRALRLTSTADRRDDGIRLAGDIRNSTLLINLCALLGTARGPPLESATPCQTFTFIALTAAASKAPPEPAA